MKIKDMVSKTSLEVQDTDLLVIEDEEDTKSITVSALKELLNDNTIRIAKNVVNEAIDNIIIALQNCKFTFMETKEYLINTWIGSTSGNVQIAVKNITDDKWLTVQDFIAMMQLDEETQISTYDFTIEVKIADAWQTAVSYTIKDYNTEHAGGDNINAVLSSSNAGFIKAHFDNLTQNEIAGITYDDIRLTFPDNAKYKHVFNVDENSFANAVPYVEEI